MTTTIGTRRFMDCEDVVLAQSLTLFRAVVIAVVIAVAGCRDGGVISAVDPPKQHHDRDSRSGSCNCCPSDSS